MKKMVMAFAPVFLLGALAVPGAAQVDRDPIATPRVEGTAIVWIPHVEYERIVLTVSGVDGKVFRQELEAGGSPSFSLFDAKGERRPDGDYAYELRTALAVPPDLQERIAAARVAEDEEALCQLERELPRGLAQPGSFAIVAGSFVLAGEPEKDIDDTASASGKSRTAGTAGAGGGPRPVSGRAITNVTAADQVIPDDLIVQGSLCVGFDCVNNESFGFDTIRLKENNLRIKFEDTSVGSFPTNDWQVTANDSASGGASKLSIEDITGAKVPFTITAGASTNSIFVSSTGRVGFRTSTPVLDLHVATSNTPALRLEQNNSGGFTAQTWDIAGNEANFFVRDVTGGSLLPFRIRPGAPTSSIDISADGDIGIGTASPSEKLHVLESDNVNTVAMVANANTGTEAAAVVRVDSDTALTNFIAHGSGRTISRFGVTLGGWNEFLGVDGNGLIIGTSVADPLILGTNSTNRLQIGGSGGVTVTGNFTVSGGTKNFAVVDPADSRRAIYYAALEGPEAGTYYRGTATIKDGEAVIELPGYFTRITEAERITVQLTPLGTWGQLYVAEKSPGRLVIRAAPGTSDLEFDYLVQGIRKGYLDFEVERPNDLPLQQ